MNKLVVLTLVAFVVSSFIVEGEGWWIRRRRSPPPPPPRINCRVSNWGSWGKCSSSCAGGYQYRYRHVTTQPKNGGSRCPSLSTYQRCNTQSCPIFHCKWSSWSHWSSCNTCTARAVKSRFRNITQSAMFGGADCTGSDYSSQNCPLSTKTCSTTCPTGYFKCRDGLTCIKPTLKCNGDDDCTDHSDEIGCTSVNSPCGSGKYGYIPNIKLAGAGFDITSGRLGGEILDNHRYNGRCVKVPSGDHNQIYRQPANIQYYRFQVQVDSSFVASSYSSASSYIEDERKAISGKIDTKSSGRFKLVGVSVQSSYTGSGNTRKVVQQASNTDAQFFKVQSNIKLAQFRTVRGNYILSHNFRRRLHELPHYYDHLRYLQVIVDFGTHFYSSGTLGGKYEYVYRYSKSDLRKSGLSDSRQKHCLSVEASVKLLGTFGTTVTTSGCASNSLSKQHGSSFTKSAREVISNVVGGSSATAASLSFNNNPSSKSYDTWVKTVKANPSMIDYELTPISVVITDSLKRYNMERALYLYMSRFDYSKCKGICYYGATRIVQDNGKSCSCLCRYPYHGRDCHNR